MKMGMGIHAYGSYTHAWGTYEHRRAEFGRPKILIHIHMCNGVD